MLPAPKEVPEPLTRRMMQFCTELKPLYRL
uniref:Uncharacterized protein n=1 Tax=Siphoviridae sp. ct47J5 TaxID=2826286 RepID=A0A8S5MK42_9CAUD|nr:MAG TPA: hypothetical protein [Siphoviridae sp. ct47J5]